MLFTTHRLDEAEYICDQIAIMIGGRMIVQGDPEFLKKQYDNSFFILLTKPKALERVKNSLQSHFLPNEVSLMSETSSTSSYLFKISKEPRNFPLSSIFDFLISLKFTEAEE